MNEPQFSPEYLEMVERLDGGDPPESPATEPLMSGSERRPCSASLGWTARPELQRADWEPLTPGGCLMVMPANHSSAIIHYWAGKYPGKLGWLIGPTALPKTKLRPWMPFALDNDAFSAWTKKREWDEAAWIAMLDRVKLSGMSPRWVLVPDVVADRDATLAKWEIYAPIAARYGWPLAIAVQDGMTPEDLPENCIVFVGGTTAWKWRSLPMWCATGRRVHVGRVNEVDRLHIYERLGVESVDGTGWMKGTETGRQARALGGWLAGKLTPHDELNLSAERKKSIRGRK